MARDYGSVEFRENGDGTFDLYIDRRIADHSLAEDEFGDALHRARVPRGTPVSTPTGVAAPRW